MSAMGSSFDFIVVGAGSAGCAVSAGLVEAGIGSVLTIEAGPRDSGLAVRAPLGLSWLMGSRRDWRFQSSPQAQLGGRRIAIPRGRMLGGSSSINSMVWFRGRRDDYDRWGLDGWRWSDVEPAFEAVERRLTPSRLADPHPMTQALQGLFGGNGIAPPTPEFESAGVFHFNIRNGRRWSAADAFLRPAMARGLHVLTGRQVSRLEFYHGRAHAVVFADGAKVIARRGIVLSAGSIGSPEILLRSGIGPAGDLGQSGIDVILDAEEVGKNLQDHPAAGLYFSGRGTGYGLSADQALLWALAPLRYAVSGKGPIASPVAEGGAFFNARGDGGAPDVQMHMIPFARNWGKPMLRSGAGYFADVCVCRPGSRGALRLADGALDIDLGLLTDPADLELLVQGFKRLREVLDAAPFGDRRGQEAFPGREAVRSEEDIRQHIRDTCATAFHPVGTLRMGSGPAPVTPRAALRGVEGLWVADASLMPLLTSANTNAPAMMIGFRAAAMIAEDAA